MSHALVRHSSSVPPSPAIISFCRASLFPMPQRAPLRFAMSLHSVPKDSPNPPYETKQGTENFGALRAIFEADDENTVFLGFENFDDLRAIFEADDEDYVFLGFENFDDLRAIFEADDENTVFLGFETCKTLEYLFQDSSGDELEEFRGFNVPVNMNDLFTDSGNEQEFLGF